MAHKCRDCGGSVKRLIRTRCGKCHAEYRRPARKMLEERLRLFVWAMKRVGCCLCGEDDPACLDYHHIDPAEKSFGMSSRVASRGLPSLLSESAKCAVVCSNCHRKHHYYGTGTFTYPTPGDIERRLRHATDEGAVTAEEAATLALGLSESTPQCPQ